MSATRPWPRLLPLPLHATLGAQALLLAVGGGLVASDSWNFAPTPDSFDKAALLDLRGLNERVAGASGFIKRSPDGSQFLLGDGTPARFWAINGRGSPVDGGKAEDIDHEARFLAKHGVNLMRVFVQLSPGDEPVTHVNAQQVACAQLCVSVMKKYGIYTIISPYWASCGLKPGWGIPGHGGDAWGVLFVDPGLQEGYRAWMKALLADTNPYTGIPLGKDPAVAVVQLQNEDSLLFWTMMGFMSAKGRPYDQLRADFGAYAARKYGSIDAALTAWHNEAAPGDEPAKGMLGFYQIWETTSLPAGAKGERAADELACRTEVMRDFNAGMERYLRQDLGVKVLINAGNWRPADVTHQNDMERWSYTANEVAATNKYYGTAHVGPDCGWAVDVGDGFTNVSAITDPLSLPTNIKQTVGQPFMITESSWTLPNLYTSEGPLLVASYSSLNGIGAYCWFSQQSRDWDDPWYHFRPIGTKWSAAHPMGVGQFPAAAWIYRHGYVKKGLAVHEERALDDIWHERTPIIAEEKSFDPNRDSDKIPSRSSVKTGVDPLAFLVGRVEVVLGGKADPAKNTVVDLHRYIAADKTVTSVTGELVLSSATGLFTLDAPRAQAAAGFLSKAGTVHLHDCDITCANDYATIMVVSLDDQPLGESGRVLVQIGTTTRATGWQDHAGDFPIDDKGHRQQGLIVDNAGTGPWTVEQASGTVVVRDPHLATATILDPNLMAAGAGAGSSSGGVYTLTLPSSALYVILSGK